MRATTFRNIGLAFLMLASASCESSVAPTEQTALTLPFQATIAAGFYNAPSLSASVRVVVTERGVTVAEEGSRTSRLYRLEQLPAGAPVAAGKRLLVRAPGTPRYDDSTPCRLRPGIYAIVEPASGTVVGILIVYPDCRMEVYTG